MLLFVSSCSIQKKNAGSIASPDIGSTKESTVPEKENNSVKGASTSAALTLYQSKYESLLGNNKKLENLALYRFMDEWLRIPYKYGGNTKAGVDCSRLCILLMSEVYQKNISGSSADIYKLTEPVAEASLREGDLVFFKIGSTSINHMGVYLVNDKFIHATTQSGVLISDLNELYYRKYFFAGGKIRK